MSFVIFLTLVSVFNNNDLFFKGRSMNSIIDSLLIFMSSDIHLIDIEYIYNIMIDIKIIITI